jgi:AraC-like DNA-binding protein
MTATPLSFSAQPGRQGFEVWREAFARKVARVDVTVRDCGSFSAEIRVRPLPDMALARNRLAPCTLMRTPDLLRDGDDSVAVMMCLAGRADIRFDDDTAVLLPGQAIVMPHHRPGGATWRCASHSYTLRMERGVARRLFPSLDAVLLRTTAPGDPAFALLSAYCAQLMALPSALPRATVAFAGAQVEELTAYLLGRHDAPELAGGSGLRAARLAAIRDDIVRNLHCRDLSAATLAVRYRLTERQVQRLFESDGTTFTEYVLTQRLARVRRLLGDPRRAHDKISTLAAEAGFLDLSHFNRTFRRRYGDTPSGVRTAALRAES